MKQVRTTLDATNGTAPLADLIEAIREALLNIDGVESEVRCVKARLAERLDEALSI